jgi:hypothetical protein
VRLEKLSQLKNPINSSGIEPEIFRLVAKFVVRPRIFTALDVADGFDFCY